MIDGCHQQWGAADRCSVAERSRAAGGADIRPPRTAPSSTPHLHQAHQHPQTRIAGQNTTLQPLTHLHASLQHNFSTGLHRRSSLELHPNSSHGRSPQPAATMLPRPTLLSYLTPLRRILLSSSSRCLATRSSATGVLAQQRSFQTAKTAWRSIGVMSKRPTTAAASVEAVRSIGQVRGMKVRAPRSLHHPSLRQRWKGESSARRTDGGIVDTQRRPVDE